MSTLDSIAVKYGTDKSSSGHDYASVYDYYFKQLRYETLRVLELGVWEGNSLLMWADYFPHSIVVGVDVSLDRVIPEVSQHSRIQLYKGSAEDTELLSGGFDIVIDDASHLETQQLLSIAAYMHRTRYFYCIEDLHTYYWLHANAPNAFDRVIGTRLEDIIGRGDEDRKTEWCAHVHPSLIIFQRYYMR